MQYFDKYVVGFDNLEIELNRLDELNVSDENLDYYCESRHNDQNKSTYYIQYFI